MLSKGTFTSYNHSEFQRVIAEKIDSLAGVNLSSNAKQTLQSHIITFFSVYCEPEFEAYLSFKKSQGEGTYASGLLTNSNVSPLEAWRNQWQIYLTGMRNDDTNLPANYRHRIKSVDLSNLLIEVISTTSANSPTAQLSMSTNFTGTIVLNNHTFEYNTMPSDVLNQDKKITWVSWRVPCRTEHLVDPGFVRFTSYWNSLNQNWILYDGTSAIPPLFNPML